MTKHGKNFVIEQALEDYSILRRYLLKRFCAINQGAAVEEILCQKITSPEATSKARISIKLYRYLL